jgi:hypothetical protein
MDKDNIKKDDFMCSTSIPLDEILDIKSNYPKKIDLFDKDKYHEG